MTLTPTDFYRRNLTALAELQPRVAETVDVTPVPEGVKPATGRDGSDTFLIPTQRGRPAWFGQSSMPTISAHEVFAGRHGDDGNVSLPGVFTGLEPLVVARKMPPHTALFVIEKDPLNLKLAMYLHDYTGLLRAGRLVLVTGEDDKLVECLRDFFESHPGHEWPGRLLTMPQRSAARIAELQRLLERAAGVVSAVHTRAVDSHVRALRARTRRALPDRPRVAVLSLDPRPLSQEQARRVGRALAKLDCPHELCIPDAPGKCHTTARLAAIECIRADLVLFINSPAEPLRSLPADVLPVASWYGPGVIVQPVSEAASRGRQMVFACSRTLPEALACAGVPAGDVEPCDVAADDTIYRPVTLSPEEHSELRVDAALLMDVPDDRPEACNIDLASHVTLWHTLQDVMTRRVETYRHDVAQEMLDTAQHQSGTTLEDAKVREHFVNLIRTRIAPAAAARSAAQTLLANACRVGLWGSNWLAFDGNPKLRCSAIPVGDALNRVFNAARVVVLPDLSAMSVQTALDALAAGASVACRRPDEPFEREHPSLARLMPHLHFYRTSRELLNTVRGITQEKEVHPDAPEAARTMVLAEHTVTHRMRFVIETIRNRSRGLENDACGRS